MASDRLGTTFLGFHSFCKNFASFRFLLFLFWLTSKFIEVFSFLRLHLQIWQFLFQVLALHSCFWYLRSHQRFISSSFCLWYAQMVEDHFLHFHQCYSPFWLILDFEWSPFFFEHSMLQLQSLFLLDIHLLQNDFHWMCHFILVCFWMMKQIIFSLKKYIASSLISLQLPPFPFSSCFCSSFDS